MSKTFFVLLLITTTVFGRESIYSSEHESAHVKKESLYNDNRIEGKKETTFDYLKNYEDKKQTEINPDTYGNRDTTGKILSMNLNNLDSITYETSRGLVDKISVFSDYNAGFSFYNFDHNYSSKFRKIFYNSKNANSFNGSLTFSLDQKIWGESFSINYLTGAGVSFFKGNGYFSDDGSEANMRVTLWVLPLDFGLATSFRIGSYARLLFGGGLSSVFAIQSRSDLSADSDEKILFQVGYGPFIATKLNIGINKIFPKFSLRLFRNYGITNTFFNIEYRYQNYSGFKDNFNIKGSAVGGGISFNFM